VSALTTSYKLQYLQSNASYYVRIAAENEEGISDWRETTDAIKPMRPLSLPSAPMSLYVDAISKDAVTLMWQPPSDTGGVPLTGYVIELLEGASTRWRPVGYADNLQLHWTVTNLMQGYEYSFRVRAENPDGVGQPIELAKPVVPKPSAWKPGAPSLVEVANVTEDSVTISWLSPERDGGARIFRYVVELCDIQRAEGWVKVREVDASDLPVVCIDELKEGKAYGFRVYAENEIGAGPAAELSQTVRPRATMTAPSVPEGPIIVMRVTRDTISIHWHPPIDYGGSPLERYIVEVREANRSQWTIQGFTSHDVTAFSITGLVEDTMYYIRVTAQNAYGVSPALETERPIIPKRVFESTSGSEVQSYLEESHHDLQVTRVVTRLAEVSERTYMAYTDEPLTQSVDTINTSFGL